LIKAGQQSFSTADAKHPLLATTSAQGSSSGDLNVLFQGLEDIHSSAVFSVIK
jgi:hypothetical protein